MLRYIEWAQKARGCYLDFLKAAFSTKAQPLPRWTDTIFELGRYSVASKALVQLASEIPALFNPMIVKPVIAPSRTPFTIPKDQVPLTCVLKRVVGCRIHECLPRLATVWDAPDVETYFRRACSLNLVVHAEIQLINFYDHNPQCKPRFRFIGVSKQSCYLCHMFLAAHSESLCVSSCHQKLSLPWIPPPATDPSVYRRYKSITNELSKLMEAAAKHDLENRLGCERRPVPADSTGSAGMGSQVLLQSQTNFLIGSDAAMEGSMATGRSITGGGVTFSGSSLPPTDIVNLMPPNMDIERATMDQKEAAIATGQPIGNSNSISILAMVFHFMRADDVNKQNIVSVRDIFDPSTEFPSWLKLLEVLKDDDELGVCFNDGQQFLIVNDRIRVTNERQFLACLQYLLNGNVLNSEALVYNF